jgi:IS4 transposase
VLLRRVRFRDPETAKTLIFQTNQTALPALTTCDLYKSRWQVELFFEWIKQHTRIERFYGTTESAVKTQIWIAVSVYVLVADRAQTGQSGGASLHISAGDFGDDIRKNRDTDRIFSIRQRIRYCTRR